MKSKHLFTAIGNIDDKFINEDAEGIADVKDNKIIRPVRIAPWLKLAMPVAACLVIAVGIYFGQNGLFAPYNGVGNGTDFTSPGSNPGSNLANDIAVNLSEPIMDSTAPNEAVLQQAYGFVMDNKQYYPISFDERKKFGLVEQDALGLTSDNNYVITDKDLGEQMGVVESSADDSLIGATVYHYSAYPDSDAICIVKRNEEIHAPAEEAATVTAGDLDSSGYAFYTFSHKLLLDGASLDKILDDYGITSEAVSQIAILASDDSHITTITDNTKFSEILGVMQGNEDIGLTAHEELMQNWIKAYDDNVDRSQLFLKAGQRQIIITTETETELLFIYNPFIRSLCTLNSFYILPEDDVMTMNTLLGVEQ